MKNLLALVLLLITDATYAQVTIKVEVSADTIRPGEFVEVTYTFENGDGQFEAPDLKGLPLVSGPNVSSSFMISNGKKSSSQSYSYVFQPSNEERLVIPHAYYSENGHSQKIESVTIIVFPEYTRRPSSKEMSGSNSTKITREKKKF